MQVNGLSRRKFATLLGLTPALAKPIATQIADGIGTGPWSVAPMSVSNIPATTIGHTHQFTETQGPKMPAHMARRIAYNTGAMREIMEQVAQEQFRIVGAIDPDIAVLRALSPMAKITFQRQRNVQRQIHAWCNEDSYSLWQRVESFVQGIIWGRK